MKRPANIETDRLDLVALLPADIEALIVGPASCRQARTNPYWRDTARSPALESRLQLMRDPLGRNAPTGWEAA